MYKAINEVLQRLHTPLDAAEMHGMLCGFVCLSKDGKNLAWLNHITDENLPDTPETQQCYKVLATLQQHLIAQLQSEEFAFAPLLPDDDAPLLARVQAVARWCQGFVYGLGIGGLKDATLLSNEAQEFIEDVTELARLDADVQTDTEKDYMQVFEYIKVGVLTLYEEKHSPDMKKRTLH
jgi:yecA family protein